MKAIAYTGSLVIQIYQLSWPNSGIHIPCIVSTPFYTDDEVSKILNTGMLPQRELRLTSVNTG